MEDRPPPAPTAEDRAARILNIVMACTLAAGAAVLFLWMSLDRLIETIAFLRSGDATEADWWRAALDCGSTLVLALVCFSLLLRVLQKRRGRQ